MSPVAVVTGAGRGLGRAHAICLASRGCRVIVNDLGTDDDGRGADAVPAREVVETIRRAGGQAEANLGSVADEANVAAMVDLAASRFGGLDIVVNNAGYEYPVDFAEIDIAAVRRLFEVHVFGAMILTRAAWPHLIRSGSGRVINTVSSAVYGMAGRTGYGAAKGALLGFTRSLACDGEPHGIKANAIAPMAGTRMADAAKVAKEVSDYMKQHMPPELVSPAVAYLAHPDCRVNGESFVVGGGKIGRYALSEGTGFTTPDLSPELIAQNMDRLLDPADLTVMTRVTLAS